MGRLSRAEYLAGFAELSHAVSWAIGRCRRSGLDPIAYAGLVGALVALNAGTGLMGALNNLATVHTTMYRWKDDNDLLQGVAGLEIHVQQRLTLVNDYIAHCEEARRIALRHVQEGHPDPGYRAVVRECDAALGSLYPAHNQLQHALRRIQAVPQDLGDTYAAAYATIRRGTVLPYDGRWITGDVPLPPGFEPPQGEPHAR